GTSRPWFSGWRGRTCAARKEDSGLDLGLLRFSGGSLVFVDQAAEDPFSADPAGAGVCCGDAGSGARVRDALVDALMGAGGVVMLLVFGQDGAQVRLVQDQGPVEELTAQGANQALADRVHPRRLDRDAHDGGAGGLEDGIEGRGSSSRGPGSGNGSPRTARRGRGPGCGPAAPSTRPSGGR